MKIVILSLSLLVVLGCSSRRPNCNAYHVDEISASGKPLMVCDGTSWQPVPGSGEARHVTWAQWEAAQGLYNRHVSETYVRDGTNYYVTKLCIDKECYSLDTFPPSGDAK
jgi:hypothetical protein